MVIPTCDAAAPVSDLPALAEVRMGAVNADRTETGDRVIVPHLEMVEAVSLAMADSEGNREAQERALRSNYDYAGYGALALAAVEELRRLGLLSGPAAANPLTGATGKPSGDLSAVPSRGVTTA